MNLKKYLPFENYNLTTKLSVEEVIKIISENIQEKKVFSLRNFSYNFTKPYTGAIIGNSFKMQRNINHRNSFLPIITGQITSFLGQTQINIKMKPLTLILIFMSLWLGVVGLVCIGTLLIGILQINKILQSGFSFAMLTPFLIFGFGILLTHFGFKEESKKSKEFIAKVLEGIEN